MKRSRVDVAKLGSDERVGAVEIQSKYARQDTASRDPKTFAKNLDRLTRMHGMTRRQVAERIGAEYQWYRRLVSKGIRRVTQRNEKQLGRLVELFGLPALEGLWDPGLIVYKIEKAGLDPEDDPRSKVVWQHYHCWPYSQRLHWLLASGKHEYLKDLIINLYAGMILEEEWSKTKVAPEPPPGAAFYSTDNEPGK